MSTKLKAIYIIKTFITQKLVHIKNIAQKLFATKTLVLISNNKIRNLEINPILQISIVAFAIFTANIFYKSTIYNQIINNKVGTIEKLEQTNQRFQKELFVINSNLEKINNYFMTIADYEKDLDDQNQISLHNQNLDEILADLDLEKNYKKTAIEIANANVILDNIKISAKKRTSILENKIIATGITINESKVSTNNNSHENEFVTLSLNTEEELSKQGGPFEEISNNEENDFNKSINLGTTDINDEINYLSNLEKFIYHAPLSRPMENYYVSSSFGVRKDPLKKVKAKHNGMDFVGSDKFEPIISPSIGEVKIAQTFGAYGKTVIIDHGYGITTRYGHLHKIKVKKGDIVKKGDVIALQGNSGRSTGSHLHYEIRYNKSPLNPKKFLKSGDKIFQENNI